MYMNRKGIVFGFKDTWSLDNTLSPIIHNALVKFKEVTQKEDNQDLKGIPNLLVCDMFSPEQLLDGHMNEEQRDLASEEWRRILDCMIYSFNLKNKPKLKDYNFKYIPAERVELENGSIQHKGFGETTNQEEYNRYRQDERLHEDKVIEGHNLFGKYFQCLWW